MSWPVLESDGALRDAAEMLHSPLWDAWVMHDHNPLRIDQVPVQSWDAVDSAVGALRDATGTRRPR